MPYIAAKPGTAFRTFTDKDTFSGDGSTTTFDMQFAIAEAGQNDLQIFIGSTQQIPGTDFTLGVDDAGDYKRITFTSAPASGSNNIVILNPGTVKGGFATVEDNAITAAKLNTSAINSQTELAERANSSDEFLVYDSSAAALKKIQTSNIVKATVQRTYTGDGTTSTFTVTDGSTAANTIVVVNGIFMLGGTDYTISSTTLTFSTTPSVGDAIDIRELPA